jgi:cysteine desulfurase
MYGPKGAGALYVKRGTRMTALLAGGSQERNRRAGTENVAGIVGLGRAAELAEKELSEEAEVSAALRDRLEERLLRLPGCQRNGTEPRVPNTSNLSFEGIEAESLLMALDLMGVAVSTGAACAAGAVEPSHVLRAMGLPGRRIEGSLRFSTGRTTTPDEIDRAVEAVGQAVERQRLQRRPSRR